MSRNCFPNAPAKRLLSPPSRSAAHSTYDPLISRGLRKFPARAQKTVQSAFTLQLHAITNSNHLRPTSSRGENRNAFTIILREDTFLATLRRRPYRIKCVNITHHHPPFRSSGTHCRYSRNPHGTARFSLCTAKEGIFPKPTFAPLCHTLFPCGFQLVGPPSCLSSIRVYSSRACGIVVSPLPISS